MARSEIPFVRRTSLLLGVLSPLLVWSCTDADPVGPDSAAPFEALTSGTSAVVLDEVPGFFFLPPLSDGKPRIDREFNATLQPVLQICDIGTDPTDGSGCVSDPVTVFAAGEADVSASEERYSWSWDTGERPGSNFFGGNATSRYFELQVAIGNVVLGSLILDPQKPNGPGQSDYPDLVYAFRVGENIPVKAFIGTDFLCDTSDPEVLECITNQVVGLEGGLFFLDGSGITDPGTAAAPPILAIRIQPNSATTEFLLTLERLAVDVVGAGCAIGLDVFRIGDQCFRVTKSLEADLAVDATVSICIDTSSIAFGDGSPLSEGQKRALEMVRWDSEAGIYEVVPGTDDDCAEAIAASFATQSVALASTMMSFGLDDDESNDDGPSEEVGIRLGGLSSSFSDFTFVLRGGVLDLDGVDGSSISATSPGEETGADPEIVIPLRVVNRVLIDGEVVEVPVPDATLRLETADGSLSAAELVTDADGNASVTWTVNDTDLGEKQLTVSSFGNAIEDLPSAGLVELEQDVITIRVLGDPAGFGDVTPTPPTLPGGTVGEAAGDVTVTVVDDAGQAIPGATVNWAGDGIVQVCVDIEGTETCTTTTTTTTGEDGTTTVTWVYGTTAGSQTMTASLPAAPATAEFSGEAAAGTPSQIVVSPTSSAGVVGQTIALSVDALRDQFGNDVGGAALSWSVVTSGGGSITGDATTAADGTASGAWTLGLGTALTARVAVGGTSLTGTFSASGACLDGFGTATIDGAESGGEWDCATTVEGIQVNLGGGATNGVLKMMNDAENAYFLLSVQQGAGADIFSLRYDFDNTGNGTSGDDDVVGYDADAGSLYDGYLSNRCVNRSQSRCFASDGNGNQQVAAAVLNAGGWTTYELSHPLDSGDGFDFDAITNASIPFFLTLSNGGGAKGNSQYPGFRNYSVLSFSAVAAPGN
jgi:hypothetical protein